MEVHVPISVGELIDKITILKIKSRRIRDDSKLINIRAELESLLLCCRKVGIDPQLQLASQLEAVKEELWDIEDKIRDKERGKVFDSEFIQLARAVYITNDRRFSLKSSINQLTGSALVEEKSYNFY